jgi:spore maturation protein CgeB
MADQFKISLVICGTGWDRFGKLPDSIKLIGAAHYDKQFDFFNESRFLINLDPNWGHGVHDRVFNAMSVGCCVITNTNELLVGSFESGVSVLTFTNINQLPTLLLEYDHAKIALCAWSIYEREHTWSERVKLLLEYLK